MNIEMGKKKIHVVKLWQVWSVSIILSCYCSSAFLIHKCVWEWGW